MKALGLSLLVSTGAFGGIGDYWSHGCPDLKPGTECTPLITGNVIEEFEHEIFAYRAGRSQSKMHGAISGATGLGVGAVRGMVDGLRASAMGAGYDSFTATLSGRSGTVSFSMNLRSGAWSIRGGGTGEGPYKIKKPDNSVN